MGKTVFEFDGIAIEADEHCWILRQDYGWKNKKKGQKRWKCGYYGSLESALTGLLDIVLKKRLSRKKAESIEELKEKVKKVKSELLDGLSTKVGSEDNN